MRIHLQLNGTWRNCHRAVCERAYHLEGITVAGAQLLPPELLDTLLCEPVGGVPSPRDFFHGRFLEWRNTAGKLHRDYGLPAQVGVGRAAGAACWWRNGMLYRASGGPTKIYADGRQEWHTLNVLHSRGGQPAAINANGQVEYWLRGKPALKLSDGQVVLMGRDGRPL